jgi:N-acyl-D-amino-acid deacylase
MHDLIIRGGTVYDGTGAPAFTGDIAIEGDTIVAVGKVSGTARREVDASGLMVAPGWVDIHTHYDGQALWDSYLTPSSWHGCTTVVMGNCGVGFAPVIPERHDWLISLMESVEDIPGAALADGIEWRWESFPGYLDALDGKERAIDIGTQVPHCAVRAYVMGDRCLTEETAGAEDIQAMADIAEEALKAGALGFSTSRTVLHRTAEGEVVPGTYAGSAEMMGIASGIRKAGHGILQMASDMEDEVRELGWMGELSRKYGVPVSMNVFQRDSDPRKYRRVLEGMARLNAEGAALSGQVSGRTAGLLLSLDGTVHPFQSKPTYREIRRLPKPERVARMRDPDIREAIISEERIRGRGGDLAKLFLEGWHKMFRLGDPPNYEPAESESFAARASALGCRPEELAYDTLMEFDGDGMIYFPFLNYADYSLEPSYEMMQMPNTVFGGSDGGAHCGVICDVSLPTHNLAFWGRDRTRGAKLPLEFLVHKQTQGTARLHGLNDRGVLRPGYKADINLIDFDRLALAPPSMAFDLPTGARRLVQRARGYRMTIKSGTPIFDNGEATGALPGSLLRGPQAAAA